MNFSTTLSPTTVTEAGHLLITATGATLPLYHTKFSSHGSNSPALPLSLLDACHINFTVSVWLHKSQKTYAKAPRRRCIGGVPQKNPYPHILLNLSARAYLLRSAEVRLRRILLCVAHHRRPPLTRSNLLRSALRSYPTHLR